MKRPRASTAIVASATALAGACSDPVRTADYDGGVGTGGAERVCEPGATQPCYPGPPGTDGVGICKRGVETCRPDGSGFGACEGAVPPASAEDCATGADDNCNGTANEADAGCTCTPGLIKSCYSGPPGSAGVGLCREGLSSCNATGTAWSPCDGEAIPQEESCEDTIDEDCDGFACSAMRWAHIYGDSNIQNATAISIDAVGNAYVGGTFAGSINFGGETLVSEGTADVFIASFDNNGNHRWSARFGGPGPETLTALAVSQLGDVLFGGTFSGAASFGDATLRSVNGLDIFLVRLDAEGSPAWAQQIGDAADQTLRGIAVDPMENVIVAGYFGGVLLCSAPPVPVCLTSAGGADVFVRKYDPFGAALWTRTFGDTRNQFANALSVDQEGNVFLTGRFEGTLTVDDDRVTNAGIGPNLFVAKLDTEGESLWLRSYGDNQSQVGNGLVVHEDGTVLISGSFSGSMDLGAAGTLVASGMQSAFVLSMSPDGSPTWARALGKEGSHSSVAIAVDPAGDVVVTGTSRGTIELGGPPLETAGGHDVFLAKLDREGNLRWGKLLGENGDQRSAGVAVSAFERGAIVLVGSTDGTIDFGSGEMISNGTDVFAAGISP